MIVIFFFILIQSHLHHGEVLSFVQLNHNMNIDQVVFTNRATGADKKAKSLSLGEYYSQSLLDHLEVSHFDN